MIKGFITGLAFSLIVAGVLMALFPRETPAPAPEAATGETMAPATEGAAEGEGAAPADGGAQPAAEEPKPDDQSMAPAEEQEGGGDAALEPEKEVAAEESAAPASEETAKAEPAAPPTEPVAEAAETAAAEAAPTPPATPAWRRNAVEFEAPDDTPLLAIVLIIRPNRPAASIALSDVDAPLTVAVPLDAPAADQAVAQYRRSGYETMIVAPFTTAAFTSSTPNDDEIAEAVRAWFGKFPNVVGVASPGPGARADSRMSRAVMRAMAAEGLAYLHSSGASTGAELRAAEEFGVATARHVRPIAGGADMATILKAIDLAAFDAGRSGGAAVIGAPTDAMLRAVVEWSASKNGRTARLAPMSAVVARLVGG